MISNAGFFSDKTVWVTGQAGLLGSALLRRLGDEGVGRLLAPPRAELDLLDRTAVDAWATMHRPDVVFNAAGRVGGVSANATWPVEFLQENLLITTNVLRASHLAGVARLINVASSAMYPMQASQPISEESLLGGPLDPSHEPYALAKIAGVKLCEAYRRQYGREFISAAPCSLYGPGGNMNPETSHVVNALLKKAHDAKASGAREMGVWGSGTAKRELLFVEDCADAMVFLMKTGSDHALVNVGSGSEISISELASAIARVVGFEGELLFDKTKPEGAPRRLTSVSRMRDLGWSAATSLEAGLAKTYAALNFRP